MLIKQLKRVNTMNRPGRRRALGEEIEINLRRRSPSSFDYAPWSLPFTARSLERQREIGGIPTVKEVVVGVDPDSKGW